MGDYPKEVHDAWKEAFWEIEAWACGVKGIRVFEVHHTTQHARSLFLQAVDAGLDLPQCKRVALSHIGRKLLAR
jgi:hypothetical protein